MDGLFHGNPYEQMDDLGGKTPLFLVQHPFFPMIQTIQTNQKSRLELIGGYRLHLEGWRTWRFQKNL